MPWRLRRRWFIALVLFGAIAAELVGCGGDARTDDASDTDGHSDGDGEDSGTLAPEFRLHLPLADNAAIDALGDIVFQPGGAAVLLDPVGAGVWVSPRCDFSSCQTRRIDSDGSYLAPVRVVRGSPQLPDSQLIVIDIGVLAPGIQRLGRLGLYNDNLTASSIVGGTYYRPTSAFITDVGDDEMQLLLAEFGTIEGRLAMLDLRFESGAWREDSNTTVIDESGFSSIKAGDFDGDGDEDLVLAQSQTYERLWLFERGETGYTSRVVFESGEPYFGLSDIQVIDFDGDGDLDVVFAHGDVLDFDLPDGLDMSEYNGVDVLLNDGSGQFEHRPLFQYPSPAMIAVADMDGDGDWDIVAGSQLGGYFPERDDYYLVAWFEQRPEEWRPHLLSRVTGFVSSIRVRDVDGDGDLDIVATSIPNYGEDLAAPRLLMFENRTGE